VPACQLERQRASARTHTHREREREREVCLPGDIYDLEERLELGEQRITSKHR
jgi:hypothetical protein